MRFRREAQIAARVIHPHLVRTYDLSEDRGHVFIVMEYLPNGSLEELIRRHHILGIEQVLRYLLQASRGLAAPHAAGTNLGSHAALRLGVAAMSRP